MYIAVQPLVMIVGWLHISFPLFHSFDALFCAKGFSQDKLICFSVFLCVCVCVSERGLQGVAPDFFLPLRHCFPVMNTPLCSRERHN